MLVVTGAGGLAIGSSGTGLAGLGILPVDGAVHIEETDTGIAIGTDPRGQNPDTAIVSDADGAEEVVGGDDVPVIVVERGSSEEPTVSPSAPPSPGGSANPAPATVPRPTAKPKPVSWRLPSDVRPELASVRGDEERLRADGCLAFEGTTVPPDCVYGDPAGTSAIALVGDSHAAQWFPAINRIAIQRHWRLLTFVKVSCPFVDMPIINLALKREYRECAAYRAAVILRLRDEQPRLTIVSGSRFAIHPVRSQDADVGAQAAALARMLDRIQGRVAVIVDTPEPGRDVPSCLSRHADDIRPCAIARATALSGDLGVIERQATRTTGDALIDLTRCVCRSWPCQVVANGIIKFRDTRHLTATFSRSLAGSLDLALDVVLGAAPRPTPSPSVAPTPSGSSSAAVATPTPVPAQTSDRLPVPARS